MRTLSVAVFTPDSSAPLEGGLLDLAYSRIKSHFDGLDGWTVVRERRSSLSPSTPKLWSLTEYSV